MPVYPAQLGDLIVALGDEHALTAYQAAAQLDLLKPEMNDAQRSQYESALAQASQQRQAARKAQQEAEQAQLDEWDKRDEW